MFKKVLLIASFLVMPRLVHADQGLHVYELLTASMTHATVSVSTITATRVDVPSLPNRLVLEIDNIDATANLWCASYSGVGVNAGRKVPASGTWSLGISNATQSNSAAINFYCISDGTATTKAFVTQAY